LQKLDNVVVQPDEVSEAMRRGIELIHPHDQDESIPYPNYAPPGTQTYQQQPIATQQHHVQSLSARRSSQIVEQNSTYNHDDRRNSQYEQYSCPSRRVSNQVFDPPFGHHQDTQPTQPTHHEVAHPPSSSDAQSGYGVRGGSVNYGGMDDGYVPDYHTGRRISATQYQQQQYEQSQPPEQSGGVVTRRTSKVSQHSVSMDSGMRRMSIHEGGSNYEDERNANSYNTVSAATSRTNSVAAQQEMAPPAYHSSHQQELLPKNAYARSNMSIEDSGDPRTIVAAHYEQTYEQVDQQIASAKQLLEERRMRTQVSPERPYPRRPKNRNSNILSAVLCLIKELDGPSLEVAEMAIRCRMEELDD